MPNTFAYIALFSWPIVVFILYRRLPRAEALITSILGGYLLLPDGVGINPPVLPNFDKTSIPVLSALIMTFLVPAPPDRRTTAEGATASEARATRNTFTRQRAAVPVRTGQVLDAAAGRDVKPRLSRIGLGLLALLFVTPLITVMQNSDPYDIGPRVLPGLKLYDAGAIGLSSLVVVLPFLMAQRYLASDRAHKLLLRGFVLWGLFYTLPALYEVRMSPQLAKLTYGFLRQSFAQTARDGGWRPVVFLPHGLWLAIFFAMTVLAAAMLWRLSRREGAKKSGRWLLAFAWLLGTLVLCHSAGALAIAVLLLPAVLLIPVRGQLILASVVAAIILIYPALRGADLIPVDTVVSAARVISPARAQSLEFRLRNEDQLLAHARKKLVAGWGGWGRSRIYDPRNGRDISVTDGAWIIIMGVSGWMGYIAEFGLLTAAIFILTLRFRQRKLTFATSGLALILAANLIDMIPNGTLTQITWMVAGALMGRLGIGQANDREDGDIRRQARRRASAQLAGHTVFEPETRGSRHETH